MKRNYALPFPSEYLLQPTFTIKLPDTNRTFINGAFLFDLYTVHGLPLDMALDQLMDKGVRLPIHFPSFIERARDNGWFDYKTIDIIQEVLTSTRYYDTIDTGCFLPVGENHKTVISLCKRYIMKYNFFGV